MVLMFDGAKNIICFKQILFYTYFTTTRSSPAIPPIQAPSTMAAAFPEAASRVVDAFVPRSKLSLTLGGKVVEEGSEVTPTQAHGLPELHFEGVPDKLYTVILSDPDAPSVAGMCWL